MSAFSPTPSGRISLTGLQLYCEPTQTRDHAGLKLLTLEFPTECLPARDVYQRPILSPALP
jgi:hypothetical protein